MSALVLEFLKKNWRLCFVVAVVLAFALAAVGWYRAVVREHALARAVAQLQEEARLRADAALAQAGIPVATSLTQSDLDKQLAVLVAERSDLAKQLEIARAAAGKLTPREVIRWRTREVPAAPGAVPLPPTAAPCLFAADSKGQIRFDGAELLTEKGTSLYLVSLSAWRTTEPRTLLFSDGVDVDASKVFKLGAASAVAPTDRKLALTLRAGWLTADLRARPELELALGYRLLKLGRVSLTPYVSAAQRYARDVDLHAGAELRWEIR